MNKFFEGFITWLALAFIPVLMGWGVISFTIWEVLPIPEWHDLFRLFAGSWVSFVSAAILIEIVQ